LISDEEINMLQERLDDRPEELYEVVKEKQRERS